jgi:hypothetical protein
MSTRPHRRPPANIELVLLGFLVSVTLKGALDILFGKTVPAVATARGLFAAVFNSSLWQLGVFLLTLLRFVYGAYRFHEEEPEELPRWVLVWNLTAMLLLFVLFYITGLAIIHPVPFYLTFGFAHGWDFVWFVVSIKSTGLPEPLKKVARTFVLIDVLTVGLLWLLWWLLYRYITLRAFSASAAIIMFLLAALDIMLNADFFFRPEKWREG